MSQPAGVAHMSLLCSMKTLACTTTSPSSTAINGNQTEHTAWRKAMMTPEQISALVRIDTPLAMEASSSKGQRNMLKRKSGQHTDAANSQMREDTSKKAKTDSTSLVEVPSVVDKSKGKGRAVFQPAPSPIKSTSGNRAPLSPRRGAPK